MEYEKHIKRLVLGYLKNECKYAYKVFLKYNFHNQYKHIPTRVAGQTLEDILRVYSRLEEIVQGRLEDTDYYKERNVEFSSSIHLDDQLLYLLDKDRPFTPNSTPFPSSPADSSVVETHDERDVNSANIRSDVETTPEHTLPGNISSHDDNYQPKTQFRKESERSCFTTACMERLSTSDKGSGSEMTLKLPENQEFHKKLPNNMNTVLNTPEIPSSSQRGENEKNKEGVGTELEDMLQDFLGTPMVSTMGKAVGAETATSASSNNTTHPTTPSRSWQHMDEHNNRAVSSILSASNNPNTKPAKFPTTTHESLVYNNNLNNFQEPSVLAAPQIEHVPVNFASNQYLLPTSSGMYVVPQPTTSTIQNGTQQQQFYIVNQPVVIPQPAPVAFIQPAPSTNKPVRNELNQKNTLTKEKTHLTEQDIMSMPTIILNERNEITYADPGSFPANTPFKLNEAHNIKEYINLFGASDQSPILKLNPQKKGKKGQNPIKPTPTIKVEIYQRDTTLPNITNAVKSISSNNNIPQEVSSQATVGNIGYSELPNLNDTENDPSRETSDEEPVKLINDESTNATNNDPKIDSRDKNKPKILDAVCTPSPLKTVVRKPTPKSGSHIRNLTFPSPIRKTAEKSDSKRSSPRITNKEQATKDLFKNENEEKNKSTNDKEEKIKQSPKTTKTPTKVLEKKRKRFKKESSKSPRKVSDKDKTKKSQKPINKESSKQDIPEQIENILPKACWDSNLRKLVPPNMEENNRTPVRRTSTRRKIRQSAELDVSDPDGKKLEEALKTPKKKEKSKCKTPSRKKTPKTLNKKKSEEKLKSQEEETKGETKILSPSKLNANKRNILSNDVDDVTPNITKECSQYPVSSKTRRNISHLLETPLKEDFIPPTPGTAPDKADTPFTPMLKANLKDFTGGETFSIDTPNFPVTPCVSAIVNTSAAYYILNDNENNKVTEATVLSEEKKSSVRKSDDEDVELSPRIYSSKEILDNFNKSCVGKKNLELLDNQGVTWDGSSDREEKSDYNSENSDDETNSTVIQNKKVDLEQIKETELLSKIGKAPGKCMATLHSLLRDDRDEEKSIMQPTEVNSQEGINTNSHNDEEDKGGGESVKKDITLHKITKSSSSGSDSEVLSKKAYEEKKNGKTANKFPVIDANADLKTGKLHDDFVENKEKEMKSKIELSSENTSKDKCPLTTQEGIRRTISEVCLENTLGVQSASKSLKEQLEEKKKRFIKLEKAQSVPVSRKNPSRRAPLKPQPNFNSAKTKRKSHSPKRVVQSIEINHEKEQEEPKGENEKNKKSETVMKKNMGNKRISECENSKFEISNEYHTVDSQDEFFKRSGTNLHRKNKESVHTTEKDIESRAELHSRIKDKKMCQEDKKLNSQEMNEMEKNQNEQKNLKDLTRVVEKKRVQNNMSIQKENSNISIVSNNPDEFEKSWDECRICEIQSEPLVVCHEESKTLTKQLTDYDFEIVQKKIELNLPCSDGSSVNVILAVSPFDTLLELTPPDECETTDGSRDAGDSLFETKSRADIISDSENAGYRTDDTDELKCARKRKHRSDSCNSNPSTKRMKSEEMELLNENNIQKLLTKLHGPNKQ